MSRPSHMLDSLDEVVCNVVVEKSLLRCEHSAAMRCSNDASSYNCMAPCGGIMTCCGRTCRAACSACQSKNTTGEDGRIVRAEHCQHSCQKALYCQHLCQNPCSRDHEHSKMCKAPCRQVCVHARCRQPCSAPCAPCQEKCTWCVFPRRILNTSLIVSYSPLQELSASRLPGAMWICMSHYSFEVH